MVNVGDEATVRGGLGVAIPTGRRGERAQPAALPVAQDQVGDFILVVSQNNSVAVRQPVR